MANRRTAADAAPAAKTRRRSARAQEEFRSQILELARTVYRERGYDALSIRAVTEPLGVSQMAFYAYFPSKAGLLLHLWNELLEEQLAALLAAGRAHDNPQAVLRAHVDTYLRYWEEHPDQYRMFMVEAAGRSLREDLEFTQTPAYERMRALHGQRVLDCLAPSRRADGPRFAEIAYIKAIGYLHATLGLGRYPFTDRATLRGAVIDDIVAGVTGRRA